MRKHFPERAPWVLLLLSVAVLLVAHQFYVQRTMPIAAYMDTLRVIALLDGWEQGKVGLDQLWGVGTAHQGLINEAFIYANIELLNYDALVANRMTGVVIALVSLLLGGAGLHWLASTPAQWRQPLVSWAGIFLFSVLVPLLLFSWNGFELLTLDLGLSLWVKNAAFLCYFVFHARYLQHVNEGSGTAWRALPLVVSAPVIILFAAMGWGFAFVGAVMAQALLGGGLHAGNLCLRIKLMVPAFASCLSLMVYVLVSVNGPQNGEIAEAGRFSSISHLLELAVASLGSSGIGLEVVRVLGVPVEYVAFVGLMMALVGLCAVGILGWKGLLQGHASVAVALVAYGGLTAAALAVGRSSAGISGVMASRYYMDLVLFLVGLLWLLLMAVPAFKSKRRVGVGVLLLSALGGVTLLQGVGYFREWKAAPYRQQIFSAMNDAILGQVPDQQSAELLQSPLGDARSGSRTMRRLGLGPFRGSSLSCDAGDLKFGAGWYAVEPQGRWTGRKALLSVPSCACTLSMTLYIPEGFTTRALSVRHGARVFGTASLTPGQSTAIEFALPGYETSMELEIDRVTVPAAVGLGADKRELGVYFGEPAIACDLQQ